MNSIDLGILAAHLVLAAEEEGLGTCMIAAFRKKFINRALGISRMRRIRLVVALGYPTENYPIRKKTRKDTNETIDIIE